MHFLCLHGRGTNSKVLEIQTAAIRYELGDHHTYDFVEGDMSWEMAPEIKNMMLVEHEMFTYFDYHAPETVIKAFVDFDNFIKTEGPYDGVIAFSQSAALVGTWMVHQARQGNLAESGLKCAIFLSAASPVVDYKKLLAGQLVQVTSAEAAGIIDIPTAHVWGLEDQYADVARQFCELCKGDVRSIFVHPGGHEVPGSSSKDAVTRSVNVIRRVVQLSVASG